MSQVANRKVLKFNLLRIVDYIDNEGVTQLRRESCKSIIQFVRLLYFLSQYNSSNANWLEMKY